MKHLLTYSGWFLTASLVALPCVRATTYDLTWSPAFIKHHDSYELRYDPADAWSTKALDGNNSDNAGSFRVTSSDGSVGRDLIAVVTVQGYILSQPEYRYYMYDFDSASAANFGGMSSGNLVGEVSVHTSRGDIPDHAVNGPFPSGLSYEFKFQMPTQVGSDEAFRITTAHPVIVTSGLYAVDPAQPAGHAIYIELYAHVTDVSFTMIPDNTSTLPLLLSTFLGLTGCCTIFPRRAGAISRAIPESSR